MKPIGLTYLAAPYTAKEQFTIEWRMEQVAKAQGRLIMEGYTVVTPLSCHFILDQYPILGTDWAAWEKYSTVLMSKCDSLVVLDIPGWDESTGVRGEISLAREKGIPCFLYDARNYIFSPLPEIIDQK